MRVSLPLVLALAGCAVATPVQPVSGRSAFDGAVYPGQTVALERPTAGAEQFQVFYQGATGFVSIQSVREETQRAAAEFCGRKGKTYRGVSETAAQPPYILGNFPRVELVFECVEPATGKYEKLAALKKLLDNGALTPAEFEQEKAKILGAP